MNRHGHRMLSLTDQLADIDMVTLFYNTGAGGTDVLLQKDFYKREIIEAYRREIARVFISFRVHASGKRMKKRQKDRLLII